VITATGTALALGCNPSAADIDAALGTATATDNCSVGTPTASDSAMTSSGCGRSQTRTWNVSDACGNPAASVSRTVTWTVDTIAPSLTAPADKTGANHVEGCDTSAISGLTYSEAAVTITAAQLSTAGGSASDGCGLSSITYQDSKTGSCPIVVTRTFTAKDVCLNTTTKTQTIEVDDTIAPSLTAPANKTGATHVEGCDTSPIRRSSPTRRSSDLTAAQLSTAGGSASDACGLSSIAYQDSKTGSCPIVVTRTFTAKDLCLNTTTKTQTNGEGDTIAPSQTPTAYEACANHVKGCDT